MRVIAPVCAAVLLVLALAPAARADQILMNDGSVHDAKILEVQEDGIVVDFTPRSGGTAQIKLPARRLDPHFFYALRDQSLGDDAKGRLRLALWAVEQGLFSRAKVQVQRAAELDPELVKDLQEGGRLAEIREGIATRVLDSARRDMEGGRLELAEQKLQALLARMPDTEAGSLAREVILDVEARLVEKEEADEQARLAAMEEEERKAAVERARLLEPVDRELRRGKEQMTQGLTEDSDSRALGLLERALSRGEAAIRLIERLERDHAEDEILMKETSERKARTLDAMVKVRLHRADIFTWRGALNQAEREVEAARAIDPASPDVAAAAKRIEDRGEDDKWGLHWQRERRSSLMGQGGSRFGAGGAARAGGVGRGR